MFYFLTPKNHNVFIIQNFAYPKPCSSLISVYCETWQCFVFSFTETKKLLINEADNVNSAKSNKMFFKRFYKTVKMCVFVFIEECASIYLFLR